MNYGLKFIIQKKLLGNIEINYGSPWLGETAKIKERLKSDFYGTSIQYESGTHYGLYPNIGLLNKFQNSKFIEFYLEIPLNDVTRKEIVYILIEN